MKMTICDAWQTTMTNRPTHYKKAYRDKLLSRIARLKGQVFTRTDLSKDHSNKEQLRLNRALNILMENSSILKISHGLYAKAMKIDLPNGITKTALQDSFELVAMEALTKLGVKWELGRAIQEYNRGETTQVPAVFSIQLHSRFRGTISAEGRTVLFEGGVNAH